MTTKRETTTPAQAATFVEGFERFWARPDPSALHDLLHPDAHLVQPMMPEMHSAAGYATRLQRLLAVCPDLSGQLRRWDAVDDGVVIEHSLGATIGGKRVEVDVFDRIRLREGKVVERIAYFDPLPVLRAVVTRPRAWVQLVRAR